MLNEHIPNEHRRKDHMIPYAVKHHIPGRIRIEIPLLKKMAFTDLKRLADRISSGGRPQGIRNISANPLTGRVTINYDPFPWTSWNISGPWPQTWPIT
jgi:Heavy metal associated domain 2